MPAGNKPQGNLHPQAQNPDFFSILQPRKVSERGGNNFGVNFNQPEQRS